MKAVRNMVNSFAELKVCAETVEGKTRLSNTGRRGREEFAEAAKKSIHSL